jgi:hypothetical protein
VKAPAIQIEQLREWQQQQPVYFQWSERELKLLMEYLKPGDVIVPKFAHSVTNTPELETGHTTVVWTFNAIALVLPRLPEREWRLDARRAATYDLSGAMARGAPICGCCFMEKPDARVRANLHPTDALGKKSEKAFLGILCDECLAHALRAGSPENLWLLKQVRL